MKIEFFIIIILEIATTLTRSDKCHCGKYLISNSRIFNGKNSTIRGRYPWYIHLKISFEAFDSEFTCGGVLISKKHVVTAAHCVHLNETYNRYVIFNYLKICFFHIFLNSCMLHTDKETPNSAHFGLHMK